MKTLSQKREYLYLMIICSDLVPKYPSFSFIAKDTTSKSKNPKGKLFDFTVGFLDLACSVEQETAVLAFRLATERDQTENREREEGGCVGRLLVRYAAVPCVISVIFPPLAAFFSFSCSCSPHSSHHVTQHVHSSSIGLRRRLILVQPNRKTEI